MSQRVLVADDDPSVRMMICALLREWDYVPLEAGDGLQAKEILSSSNPPRVAILDWMMPGMSGVEVCSWLEQNRNPFVYRILVTSRNDKEDLTYALNNGAHQFMTKPIDAQILRAHVQVAIRLLEADDKLVRMERIAAVGTLAGGIAHQYNNMNAGIMGYVDYMINAGGISSEYRQLLIKVDSICRRMKEMTDTLLDFAYFGVEQKSLVSFGSLAEATISLEQEKINEQQIMLMVDLRPTPPLLLEKNPMIQAFLHLLINARHAVIGVETPRIEIRCGYEGGRIFFRVTDNGIGIDPDNLRRIFSPFFTLKGEHAAPGSAQSRIRGYGLGLSVADSIIRAHGGELSVRSIAGQGSTFTVYFNGPETGSD